MYLGHGCVPYGAGGGGSARRASATVQHALDGDDCLSVGLLELLHTEGRGPPAAGAPVAPEPAVDATATWALAAPTGPAGVPDAALAANALAADGAGAAGPAGSARLPVCTLEAELYACALSRFAGSRRTGMNFGMTTPERRRGRCGLAPTLTCPCMPLTRTARTPRRMPARVFAGNVSPANTSLELYNLNRCGPNASEYFFFFA